jgi:transposase-like protein
VTARVRQRADGLSAKNPSASLVGTEGLFSSAWCAPVMKIVETNPIAVETALVAGLLNCPACDGRLAPWGFARSRLIRILVGFEDRIFRRSRCSSCKKTHVLVPSDTLVRRRDGIEVIGSALTSSARGVGLQEIADGLDRPAETVRDWLRRARARAEEIRAHFTLWSVALDGSMLLLGQGSAFSDAVDAMGCAGRAAVLRKIAVHPWHFCSGVTGGTLLCNTNPPWPKP